MHIDDFGRGTPVIFQNRPGVKGRGDKLGVPRGEPFVRNERMDGQFQDPDRAIRPEPARMSPASACTRTATSSWPVAGRLARRRASGARATRLRARLLRHDLRLPLHAGGVRQGRGRGSNHSQSSKNRQIFQRSRLRNSLMTVALPRQLPSFPRSFWPPAAISARFIGSGFRGMGCGDSGPVPHRIPRAPRSHRSKLTFPPVFPYIFSLSGQFVPPTRPAAFLLGHMVRYSHGVGQ